MIGVLALQGDFREHAAGLAAAGAAPREVRLAADLDGLQGLVLPGGESTTIARLLLAYALHAPIRAAGLAGLPIWGTCAGAILLATDVPGLDRPPLGLLPMTVDRNAYGRQVDSFETDLAIPVLGPAPYHAVFIRAPRIRSVGADVAVLARHAESPVVVRRGTILATTFHPELTPDRRLATYFVEICTAARQTANGAAPAQATEDIGAA